MENIKTFSTSKAVRNLRDGATARQVFEPVFGWPLPRVSAEQLTKTRPFGIDFGVDKAIVNTLRVAALGDIAHKLFSIPSLANPGPDEPLNNAAMRTLILPQALHMSEAVKAGIESFTTGEVNPLYDSTYLALAELFETGPDETKAALTVRLTLNQRSLDQFSPHYLYLLRNKTARNGTFPDSTRLAALAVNSAAILGQAASHDPDYRQAFLTVVDTGPNMDTERYNPAHFVYKFKNGLPNEPMVAMTRQAKMSIDREYARTRQSAEPLSDIYVVTGCPANSAVDEYSLIQAALHYFARGLKTPI